MKKNGMIQTHADYLAQLPHLGCPLCNQLLNPHLLAHDLEDDLFEYFKEKQPEMIEIIVGDEIDTKIANSLNTDKKVVNNIAVGYYNLIMNEKGA